MYDGIPYRYQVKQRAGDWGITAENIGKSQHTDFNKGTTTESASVPVATYGCESWTLRKNEETRLDAFKMKGLRKIFQFSWTGKKTNEWSKEGAVRHRRSKEASILWSHHKETRELRGERDNARNNPRCTQARRVTHGLDGQHQDMDRRVIEDMDIEESVRMRHKGESTFMMWPTLGLRTAKEQNTSLVNWLKLLCVIKISWYFKVLPTFVDCDTHTHTHPFNGPLSGTTWVSRYQNGKTNLDFTEAKDS